MNKLVLSLLALWPITGAFQAYSQDQKNLGLQHVRFVVRLATPISTETNSVNNTISGFVEEPPQYREAVFDGRITELKAPKRGFGKGKASIAFQFEKITLKDNRTFPVSASVTDVENSKGVKSVDDEGRVIGASSSANKKKGAIIGGIVGVAAGAVKGGATGAAVGAATGAAAGYLIAVTITSSGEQIEFQPGSRFTLDVSDPRK